MAITMEPENCAWKYCQMYKSRNPIVSFKTAFRFGQNCVFVVPMLRPDIDIFTKSLSHSLSWESERNNGIYNSCFEWLISPVSSVSNLESCISCGGTWEPEGLLGGSVVFSLLVYVNPRFCVESRSLIRASVNEAVPGTGSLVFLHLRCSSVSNKLRPVPARCQLQIKYALLSLSCCMGPAVALGVLYTLYVHVCLCLCLYMSQICIILFHYSRVMSVWCESCKHLKLLCL